MRYSGIRAGLGDGRSEKIAHCVGDVDKSTLSENLGAGVEGRWERRPRIAAARAMFGGRMRSQVQDRIEPGAAKHRNYAEILIAVNPVRTQERNGVAKPEFRAGTKGRP